MSEAEERLWELRILRCDPPVEKGRHVTDGHQCEQCLGEVSES